MLKESPCRQLGLNSEPLGYNDFESATLSTAPARHTTMYSSTILIHSKLIVGSFYRPPDKGIEPILNLETELSEITEKLRNNSKYTVMLGGDFNAANIDWDTGIVPDSTDSIFLGTSKLQKCK